MLVSYHTYHHDEIDPDQIRGTRALQIHRLLELSQLTQL